MSVGIFSQVTKADAQSKIIEALARNTQLNMWGIKEQKHLPYSTVHKAVNALQKEGLIQAVKTQKSEKGMETKLFCLTFRGFIRYLSGVCLGDSIEKQEYSLNLNQSEKKPNAKKEEFISLVSIIETHGNMLDYVIFKEIRWLEDHYESYSVYDIVDIAKVVETLQPFSLGGTQLIEHFQREKTCLKEQKIQMLKELEIQQKNKTTVCKAEEFGTDYLSLAQIDKHLKALEDRLEILLKQQNEWWKRGFAIHFAERYQPPMQGTGDMHNESLHKFFKQVAEEIRVLEVEPMEKIAQVFSGGK